VRAEVEQAQAGAERVRQNPKPTPSDDEFPDYRYGDVGSHFYNIPGEVGGPYWVQDDDEEESMNDLCRWFSAWLIPHFWRDMGWVWSASEIEARLSPPSPTATELRIEALQKTVLDADEQKRTLEHNYLNGQRATDARIAQLTANVQNASHALQATNKELPLVVSASNERRLAHEHTIAQLNVTRAEALLELIDLDGDDEETDTSEEETGSECGTPPPTLPPQVARREREGHSLDMMANKVALANTDIGAQCWSPLVPTAGEARPQASNMSKSKHVKVIIRTRPTSEFAQDIIKFAPDNKGVHVHIPKNEDGGYINNQQEDWDFRFDNILHNASQETIYEECGAPIVKSLLEGFNGTIMAYGQTGAGKTFT
ncbi:hypothetical protein BDK51DRAFT_26073, partial [Blyttiomyces helicus]